ncbi:hypothetical protein IWX46DRAFT_582684 [Phyllosticta citricarpa]|uniref:Uncharacterized protein n=1 Tax=Phyllosticta citricarpa TaxID=55181 RepID=A0ABR1M2S1_9PEZI
MLFDVGLLASCLQAGWYVTVLSRPPLVLIIPPPIIVKVSVVARWPAVFDQSAAWLGGVLQCINAVCLLSRRNTGKTACVEHLASVGNCVQKHDGRDDFLMNDIADLQRRNREIALHFALLQHTPVEHDGDDDAITSETDSGFVITSATTKTTTITAATSASGSEKSEGAANPSKTPRLPPVNEATSHANECNYDADGDDQQVQGAKNDMQQHDEHPEQQKHSPTAENQAIDALEAFLTSDAVEQGSFPSGHDHLVHHVSHGGTNYALNNDGLAKGDFTTWLTRQIASAQTFVDDLAAFRTRGQESTQRFDYLWSAAA